MKEWKSKIQKNKIKQKKVLSRWHAVYHKLKKKKRTRKKTSLSRDHNKGEGDVVFIYFLLNLCYKFIFYSTITLNTFILLYKCSKIAPKYLCTL